MAICSKGTARPVFRYALCVVATAANSTHGFILEESVLLPKNTHTEVGVLRDARHRKSDPPGGLVLATALILPDNIKRETEELFTMVSQRIDLWLLLTLITNGLAFR